MNLIKAFVDNPVKVTVGALLVAIFGGIAMFSMPKQLTPEVETPMVMVSTRWPGASPQEIEREIILEQEEQLKSVEGMIKMSSTCRNSSAEIELEFAVGTNLQEAVVQVSSRLQQVRQYPVDAQEPVIETRSTSDSSIARLVLSARPPTVKAIQEFAVDHPALKTELAYVASAMNSALRVYRLREVYKQRGKEFPGLKEILPPDIDLMKLRRFTEDVVEARLERVPGVSDVYTYGGLEEELEIVLDPEALAIRQLTVLDVLTALRGQNKDTSGGDIWEGKRRWVIRTLGQFRDNTQVEELIVAMPNQVPVYLGDVAEVRIGYKKADSVARRYGERNNGLGIQRRVGANVIEVMKGIREAVAELNAGVLAQKDLELYQYYDETEYINSAISLVTDNIFLATSLTMIVLMLFLHRSVKTMLAIPVLVCSSVMAVYISPWFFLLTLGLIVGFGLWFGRGALVIGIAIPVSSVATFLALGIAGRSFNVISLAGMAFAVGMLVDNAVVVLENIHRRIQQGEPSFQAAVSGTKEVAGAIIASTLTTVAVFLPVVFVEDTSGQLFRDIALAISFAVIFSLVCATTLMPTAAARLYLDFKQEDSSQINKLRWLNRLGSGGVEGIVRLNQMIQRSAVRAVSFVAFVLLAVVVLTIVLWPKLEYLPAGNRNMVFIRMSPPPGYNMDELMEMGKEIEEDLEPIWNANPQEEDQMDFPVIAYYFFSARTSGVAMGVQAYDPLRVAELMPRLKTYGDKFPGTRVVASQASLFGRGFSGGRTIDVEITGRDLEKLIGIGGEVIDRLQSGKDGVPSRLADAQMFPRPSLDLSSPEIHLIPDKVACAELGVTADELGYTVDAFVDGAYAGDFFYGGDKVDITLKGDRVVDLRTQDLEDLPIATRSGKLVPLSALADIEYSSGPEQIMRRERLRAITIQVTPPPEIALEEAMDIIKNDVVQPMLKDGSMGTGNVITLSGAADKLNQTWESLRWNLLLALVITYLLMAALFESWLYPLVIIFSVPLGAVGGLLGLALLNVFVLQTLDVLTMLGFVILIGTVVNNAILIVHQALNHIQEDGMQHREAIPLAVRSRIRPISITTITTVLGLLPLVLFPGAGSELYRGLGSVVLGGLLVSTVLTLVLVPTVFTLFMDARLVVANWLSASGIPEQALPVED